MENSLCKFKIFKSGFTLAEVLITIVIIGVIAAMTIPTLINNTKKQEFVAGLKKANSTLQQALLNMSRNNDATAGDYSFLNDKDFIDEFAKVVSVTKICDGSACFPNYTSYKRMDNGSFSGFSQTKSAVLADGQIITYLSWANITPNCDSVGISQEDGDNAFGRVFIDVNGNKPPNVMGRDVFYFVLVNGKGFVPAGSESTARCSSNSGNSGSACTAKVLREGAMNY